MATRRSPFLLLLGVDPGPSRHGWALVKVLPGERPDWAERGQGTTDQVLSVSEQAAKLRGARLVVALERPQGFVHEHKRGAALLATAFEAGALYGRLCGQDKQVLLASAEQWRAAVCGRPTATDATVKKALGVLLTAMPKRSSVHTRDAAGVALGVALALGWLVNGRGRAALGLVERGRGRPW